MYKITSQTFLWLLHFNCTLIAPPINILAKTYYFPHTFFLFYPCLRVRNNFLNFIYPKNINICSPFSRNVIFYEYYITTTVTLPTSFCLQHTLIAHSSFVFLFRYRSIHAEEPFAMQIFININAVSVQPWMLKLLL